MLIQKNWAPRGAETAQTLYNISRGWVTHNEVGVVKIIGLTRAEDWIHIVDECVYLVHCREHHPACTYVNHGQIFGYTGMKGVDGTASWANYPESAVWMVCSFLSPRLRRQLLVGSIFLHV